MIRIYVRKPGQQYGRVYKSKSSIAKDRIKALGYLSFVLTGLISEAEWAESQQLIVDKFNLQVVETTIDGRSKVARYMPYFSWNEVLNSNHQIKNI